MKNWQSRSKADMEYYDNILKKNKMEQKIEFDFDSSSSSVSHKRHDSDLESDEDRQQDIKDQNEKAVKIKMKEALGVESDSDLSLEREDEEQEEIAQDPELYKHAATVYRDASGKQVSLEELKMNTLEMKKMKLLQRNKENMKIWEQGYKQKLDRDQKNEQLRKIKLEQEKGEFDNQQNFDGKRFNDPMAHLIQQEKESTIKDFSTILRCKFKALPNRFGIQPGWRWDGVERGNGYEQKLFQKVTNRKIKQQQSYIENTKEM